MRAHLKFPAWFQTLLVVLLACGLLAWLNLTPSGLFGKADAIGYAVCHRIPGHSYWIGERQFPLCARCSGMYLGALIGFLYLGRLGRRAGLPVRRVQLLLAAALLAFALDGVNSYLTFFPQLPHLYQPLNALRLLTGLLVGIGIASILLPTFNSVVWQSSNDRPVLDSLRHFAGLLGCAGLAALALVSDNPLLAYPLVLLSVAGLLSMLTLAYSLAWILFTRKENSFQTWREFRPVLLLSAASTLLQIAALDAARYLFTGSWAGFNL